MGRKLLVLPTVSRKKSIRRALVAMFTLVLALGNLAPASAQSSSGSSGSSVYGAERDKTQPLSVGERDVLVSLPVDYDPALSYPVLLAFGGWGVSPEELSRVAGLRAGSDAIIAYGRGVGDAWAGAPYSRTSMDEDVRYSRAVVDRIADRYSVDRSRVYAIGHSNGGAFALSLACRAPDLMAGVVSVSGMFYDEGDGGCRGGGVPVMFIHAVNDDVALINGGVRNGAHFLPVHELFQRWGVRNGCLPLAAHLPAFAPDASHRLWTGCRADSEIVISESAGHPWPRHAPAVAWDFLSRQFS